VHSFVEALKTCPPANREFMKHWSNLPALPNTNDSNEGCPDEWKESFLFCNNNCYNNLHFK